MATSKTYFARSNYQFLSGDRDHHHPMTSDTAFELTESEIFNSIRSNSPDFGRPAASNILLKKPSSKRSDSGDRTVGTPSSLPLNIPDWSKILRDEYRENRRRNSFDDDDEIEGDDDSEGSGWIPPHELLARTRIASFSVHEGVGRTLKGRDLSRVRNAIWEKTGFQD